MSRQQRKKNEEKRVMNYLFTEDFNKNCKTNLILKQLSFGLDIEQIRRDKLAFMKGKR